MFRVQVALTLFVAFAAAAAVLWWQVDATLTAQVQQGLDGRLKAARVAVLQAQRQNDDRMVALAEQIAASPSIAAQLARRPEALADPEGAVPDVEQFRYEIHKRMNDEVQAWSARLAAVAEGKTPPPTGVAGARLEAPDWFVVVDAAGVGVANASDKAWYGPCDAAAGAGCDSDVGKQQAALKAVLEQGTLLADVWMVKGAPMTVGAAPVRQGETLVGAVIVGQRLTEAEARRQAGLVGTEVAHFRSKAFNKSTSLSSDLEPQLAAAFEAAGLFTGKASEGNVAFELGGRRWLAATAWLPAYPSAPQAGVAVLIEAQSVFAEAQAVLVWIPVAALVGFLVCLGAVVAFFRRFVAPFEELDRGVLELVNDNKDYWFDVPGQSLAGTMSQNLNLLACKIPGREVPEELAAVLNARAQGGAE